MANLEKLCAPGIFDPPGYTQCIKVTGAQSIIFLAGQVAYDKDGKPAHPGDFKGQARAVFSAIKAHGGSVALATDCQSDQLQHYRTLLGIDDLLDAIACGDEVSTGKPDPGLVELVLRHLGGVERKEPDPRHFLRLLRLGSERQCEKRARRCADKSAPIHH